ncbi:carboxypeptidase regulatory-like domain-containing protein [Mucilaginibacter agri]|uniref:Carboxypeptidase regulatory-like domain-containing protein n=1 Tax=Mucilaginibacter agri TaxID=2695265 RepID=A0A965ZJ37_9SPHI|nr:carboxypeptidase regulatory-like domain-containing protein [Mucilaginibacter agri]NCD70581.1 carboxypeptidase regulatory-like domain-containing protein [Mucilaginibacter agri]
MKRYTYLLLFFVFVSLTAFAQRDSVPLNSIIEKAVKTNNDHPIEKIYLHTDKPYYAVGDTIWFKAYLTMDIHAPSELSKVVNVEIINPRDSVIEELKLPVANGTAFGNITLAGLNYRQGNYRIRAYTQWMLNYNTSYMFDKIITIGSAVDKDLNTNVTYSGNINDKNSKLNARILFRGTDGVALTSRKVDWRVEKNGDVILKGRGNTDANGYLSVWISPNKREDIIGGSLITAIETNTKKTATSAFTLKNAFNGVDVQFFPDGGMLVANVQSQLAFKAIQSNGLGVDIKGNIVDNQGKEVLTFASQHLGMGKVLFTPQPTTSYTANVQFPDGSKASYNLPRVAQEGISLAVNNANPHTMILQISASPNFYQKNKNKTFYIIAKNGGFVTFAAQSILTDAVNTAAVPKSKFKTGVVEVTLLSSAGEPLSERLVFVNHDDMLNIGLTPDKPSYATRGKVSIGVSAKMADKPVAGSFSVAVIDETKVPFNEDAETTILSNMLLTSDVSGYVEQPSYYFNKPDIKKNDDLDVLMMTQGFRQFSISDVVGGKIAGLKFAPEQGITMSGNLRKLNGMPVFKGAVRLMIPDRNYSAETTTNADGEFAFKGVVFSDSSKVTISARNNVDSKNMKLTMDAGFYPVLGKTENYPDEVVNIDSTLAPSIKNSEKQYQFNQVLKEVVVKASTIKKVTHQDYPALSGLNSFADHDVNMEMLSGCNNFLMCLSTALVGITYRDNNFYITRDYNNGNKKPVQFYVKGMPVDVNFLASITPSEVSSIEIFNSDGFSGINRMNNSNGVVSINMKEAPKGTKVSANDLKQLFPDPNVITFTPKGYARVRQFYLPKYDVSKSVQAADLRTTIYWNPGVITDATGAATLNFYNADGRGTYKAVIEGIDVDGNIGRKVVRYTVK